MIIKELKLYTFEELSDSQKGIVIAKNRDINVDYGDWDDCILENYVEKGEKLGLVFNFKTSFYYSGFNSQGDGACIASADLDLFKFLEHLKSEGDANFAELKPFYDYMLANEGLSFDCSISQRGHSYHSKSMNYNFNFETSICENPDFVDLFDALESKVRSTIEGFCDSLYKDLSNSYDYLTSDEAVKDTLIANEFYFNGETLDIEGI